MKDQLVHINSSSYTSVNLRVHFKLYLGSDSDDKDISQHRYNKMLPMLGC